MKISRLKRRIDDKRKKSMWLSDGDWNEKYFHQKASQQRSTNLITQIKGIYGTILNKKEDIANIFVDYFKSI